MLYADNGADGIRLLAEHPEVDIVLMDAMMPDQDGNETTRGIRRNPALRRPAGGVPDGQGDAGRPGVGLAAGASDYITKPVDLDELLALMAALGDRRPARRTGRRPDGDARRG